MAEHFNPFCMPGRTKDDPGPLCPWVDTEHENGYISVDGTEDAFQQFSAKLTDWNLMRDGIAVLVAGEDGCGKTSLIHRCAARLMTWQKETYRQEGVIVDRSFENLSGMVILKKCEDTANGILQGVRERDGFLAPDVSKSLPEIPSGGDQIALRRAIEELSRKLGRAKRHAAVICPKIELPEELQTYLSIFYRAGVSIFLESDDDAILRAAQRLSREGKKTVTTLQVGGLSVDDGWRFVEARMKRLTDSDQSPAFARTGVDEYMQKRMTNARISVRELERVCMALYVEAKANAHKEIRYQHFADYYLRIASLGGSNVR
ncbi:MAG: hypothetical protein ACO1TE_11210 [Prosthecobacter sp.]